jgi:hypothetical protein
MPTPTGSPTDAANRAYVDALEARVATLETAVGTLQGQVATLITDLAALTARVDAEHPLPPAP